MWRLALFLPRCVAFVAAVALVLLTSAVEAADGAPANLFPIRGLTSLQGMCLRAGRSTVGTSR